MSGHRVDQTILASDPKRQGNCLSACVATYLGIDLEAVPHFVEHDEWWSLWLGFMAGHGRWAYDLEDVTAPNPGEISFVMGMSERGVCHQVLYRDGELYHDPHPSKAGLLDVREVLVFRPVRHDHTATTAVGTDFDDPIDEYRHPRPKISEAHPA